MVSEMGFEDKKMQKQRHSRSKRFVNFTTFFLSSNSRTWVVKIKVISMLDVSKFGSFAVEFRF